MLKISLFLIYILASFQASATCFASNTIGETPSAERFSCNLPEYEFQVRSICASTGEPGGATAQIAKTNYVIIEDIIVFYSGGTENNDSNYPLFTDDRNPEDQKAFKMVTPTHNTSEYLAARSADNASKEHDSNLLRINPNLFNDQLVLKTDQHISGETARVVLFDVVSGCIIYQAFWAEGNQMVIPTADLPSGAYLLQYETPSTVQTTKVIKMK